MAWRALGALCAADYGIAARAHAGGWTRLLAAWASSGGSATTAASAERDMAGAAGGGAAGEAGPWVGTGWSASQARALRAAALEGLTTLAVSCPAVRTACRPFWKAVGRAVQLNGLRHLPAVVATWCQSEI